MSTREYALTLRVKALRRKLKEARHTADQLAVKSVKLTEDARAVTRQLGRAEALETSLQTELYQLLGEEAA